MNKVDSHRQLNPAQFQTGLSVEELILREGPQCEDAPIDVVFVGGGPAGLAGAI